MPNDYKIKRVMLKALDFELFIIEFPAVDIEDKLVVFAKEANGITKVYYEDYIISICVANINQLIYRVNKVNDETGVDKLKIRQEVIDAILSINPSLDPSKLVINRNNIIKIKKGTLKKEDRLLINNKGWNETYEDKLSNIYKQDKDKADVAPAVNSKETKSTPNQGRDFSADKTQPRNKKENPLSVDVKDKWWKRIGRYVPIKVFKENDLSTILKQKSFNSRMSFEFYVVSLCVVDYENIFILVDELGLTDRLTRPVLMHELYILCKEEHPFLTYEKVQKDPDAEEDEPEEVCENKTTTTTAGAMMQQVKKKPKKKFKDIPKEDLLNLGNNMKLFLVGQDEAIDGLVDSIQRSSVGLKDPNRPIGSFLFAGKTGVGKTEATKILANELIKGKDNLITIDCSEYTAEHEYSKLIGCFVPGTKVLMSDGGTKNIEEIHIGDEVISHTGNKRKVEFVHEYDQNGEMLEIITANSNIPVITTKTHEVYAIKHKHCDKGEKRAYRVCKPTCKQDYCVNSSYNNYKLDWIPASELEEGDIVAYPRYKATGNYPNRIDLVDYVKSNRCKYDDKFVWLQANVKINRYIEIGKDLAKLVGYYVSEGGTAGKAKSVNFTFNSKETTYITEVVDLLRKLFGENFKIKIEDRTENHSYRIWVSSKIICSFMSALFGHNTYVKHLPEWFKELPDDIIKCFLETAVFGDGCTVVPRRMDYSTVSSTLYYQMELLFRRLGYITYKSLEPVSKRNVKCVDRYRLYIGGNQIEQLNKDFDFNINLSEIKQTNIQRKAWIDEDYLYLQIKSIKNREYKGKVYDLAVEKDVSYVTEFIVHNSPAGYIGHEHGGFLTNAVTKNPFCVVVFDEIEKASYKVHQLLLQILEEGRLTDGKGKTVSFNETIVIMTSNVGVKEIDSIKKTVGFGDVAKVTDEKKNIALEAALKKQFKPEFLNRIGSTIFFKNLNKKDYMHIIELELYKLNDYLKSNDTDYKDLELRFDDKIKKLIYKKGINEEYGARPLKRCIEKIISTELARKLLSDPDLDKTSVVEISTKGNKASFNVIKKIDDAPFYMSTDFEIEPKVPVSTLVASKEGV